MHWHVRGAQVAFRFNGLAKWLKAGLTFWWFDHNWGFSIPPPFVNTSHTSGVWEGLDNAAWGSHVYYSVVAAVDRARAPANRTLFSRPMALTKFGLPDWRPGMTYEGAAESPAQHRYPVWWTGDGVNLQASIETMVDAGVHGFKPFVHSDCGGDYRSSSPGDLLRWTAHCAFGSILRFHGADHRPWTYGAAAEATVKSYLDMRYKLLPSLIAAGQQATADGTPLVARCDLLWPAHPEAASNLQYLFLNETLVAPIYDSTHNLTTRPVWIPPGRWADAWNGSLVTGPASLSVTLPYERVPMWHKADGGLVLAVDEPATRVADQDWSTITLHAFPALDAMLTTRKTLHERGGDAAPTRLVMSTFGDGRTVRLQISRCEVAPADDAVATARGWRLRLQLPPTATAATTLTATIDGTAAAHALLLPLAGEATPFGSRGARPAAGGAAVLELEVPFRTHPASAPHPLRFRYASLPACTNPCTISALSCSLLAPFLHPSCTRSAGAAGHAAAHSRGADRWRPKRRVCRRVRRSWVFPARCPLRCIHARAPDDRPVRRGFAAGAAARAASIFRAGSALEENGRPARHGAAAPVRMRRRRSGAASGGARCSPRWGRTPRAAAAAPSSYPAA